MTWIDMTWPNWHPLIWPNDPIFPVWPELTDWLVVDLELTWPCIDLNMICCDPTWPNDLMWQDFISRDMTWHDVTHVYLMWPEWNQNASICPDVRSRSCLNFLSYLTISESIIVYISFLFLHTTHSYHTFIKYSLQFLTARFGDIHMP